MSRTVALVLAATVVIALGAVAWFTGLLDASHLIALGTAARRAHDSAAITSAFVLTFAAAVSLGLPATPFMLAASVLFGAREAIVLSLAGSTLGCAGGYWLARSTATHLVERWLARHPRWDSRLSGATRFVPIVRIRLLPLVPVPVASYAAGIARAPFWSYLAASAIGMAPSIVVTCAFAAALVSHVAHRGEMWASLTIAAGAMLALTLIPLQRGHQRADTGKR